MKQLDCPQCGRKCASEAALKAYVCGKCGLHAYCSEACARTHWRQHGHHNRLCLIYRVAEALLNRARQLGDESAKEYWTGVLMSVLYHYPTSRPVSMLMYTHSRDALQSNFRGLDLGHLRVVSLQALLRLGMFQQALDFQAWWRGDTHSSSSSNSNSSSMGMGVYLGVRGSDVTAPENMDECRSLPAWWIVVLLLLKYQALVQLRDRRRLMVFLCGTVARCAPGAAIGLMAGQEASVTMSLIRDYVVGAPTLARHCTAAAAAWAGTGSVQGLLACYNARAGSGSQASLTRAIRTMERDVVLLADTVPDQLYARHCELAAIAANAAKHRTRSNGEGEGGGGGGSSGGGEGGGWGGWGVDAGVAADEYGYSTPPSWLLRVVARDSVPEDPAAAELLSLPQLSATVGGAGGAGDTDSATTHFRRIREAGGATPATPLWEAFANFPGLVAELGNEWAAKFGLFRGISFERAGG